MNLDKIIKKTNFYPKNILLLGAADGIGQAISKILINISQVDIVKHSFIDKSVVSSKLTQLNQKKLIKKLTPLDNRSNKIELSKEGVNMVEKMIEEIIKTEHNFFNKLNHETFNFINSLKLLLGKKIRIKANYNE